MSSYYVADFVNGRNLHSGVPVVGFLVTSQAGVYPRDTDPNTSAIRPADYFMPQSFPIFGKAEDRGLMEVGDESSLAVRLALAMTGTSSWDELSENAFERRLGVQFLGAPDVEGRQSNRRVYGLALMHRETFDHLVRGERSVLGETYSRDGYRGEHRVQADKVPDIRAVKAILNTCLRRASDVGPPGKDTESIVNNMRLLSDLGRICSLAADPDERRRILPEVEAPPALLEALGTRDGKLVGDDLREVLRQSGMLGNALLKGGHLSVDTVSGLDELLSLLWDCLHLKTRLYDVHAHFKPSSYAGEDYNYPSVLELGRVTMKGVWAEFVNDFCAHSSRGPEQMEAELARMEAMVAEMRQHFEDLN